MKKLITTVFLLSAASAFAALPDGYTPVDGIFSTAGGKQWINTGYTPACTDRIEFKVKIPSLSTMCVYCSRTDAKVDTFTCFLEDKNGYRFRFDRKNEVDNGYSSQVISAEAVYAAVADGSTCACTLNDAPSATMGSGTFTPGSPLVLFASHKRGAGTIVTSDLNWFAVLTMYYFRVADKDGNVKVDLMPCKNASGVAGLYDLRRNAFYPSLGDAAFGAIVIEPTRPVAITGVIARQRWPWNNLVDVDFNLDGSGRDGELYRIEVKAQRQSGGAIHLARTLPGGHVVEPGARRVTWDFGKDCPNVKATDMVITVSATTIE